VQGADGIRGWPRSLDKVIGPGQVNGAVLCPPERVRGLAQYFRYQKLIFWKYGEDRFIYILGRALPVWFSGYYPEYFSL